MTRPAVFIGSSSEGIKIANAIQLRLDQDCEVEPWNQGVFGLTQGTLESLVLALPRFDFAILVLTADDLSISRGQDKNVARDNVLFELGLFIGALGRERTFIIYDRSNPPSLPSDLAGITATTFEPHSSGNLEAALGAPCTRIMNQVEQLGIRPERSLKGQTETVNSVEGIDQTIQKLITLLAKSRKMDPVIISDKLDSLMPSAELTQIQQKQQDLDTPLIESKLKTHPEISALYKHPDRKRAAEAAISFFCYGTEPVVRNWKTSTTWRIVESVFKTLKGGNDSL